MARARTRGYDDNIVTESRDAPLTCFWIVPTSDRGPLGIGVTADDFDDAIALLVAADLGRWAAREEDRREVVVAPTFDDLPRDVRERCGPMPVRGVWYPWPTPAWFAERR